MKLLHWVLALSIASTGCQKKETKDAETSAAPSATATAVASSTPAKPGDLPAPPDVAAPPANAEKTASGLASIVLTPGGGGNKPTESDKVRVHYTGWSKDGGMFDSSVTRGQPATFGVTQVIKGWTEGLQLMTVGEKRRFWIPGDLAYGDTPRRPGAPAGQLTFDVELLEIIEGPKPIPAPEDVAEAPKDAKKTKTGLAYNVLQKGTGKVHPKETSRVSVHYTGWTTDGKMFDSSVTRGAPMSFSLNAVIPGWTEGVQLMVEGEKTRFWIPGSLAYGDKPRQPGAPAGTLVFDVELLKIFETPPSQAGSRPTAATPGPRPPAPKSTAPKSTAPKPNATTP